MGRRAGAQLACSAPSTRPICSACLGVLLAAGVELEQAAAALAQLEPVAGRVQMLRAPGRPLVVVDYAHTPDALEKVWRRCARCCVGRRAAACACSGAAATAIPGKRPLMGEVATRLAHRAIVTSDNPRSEDPRAIIERSWRGAHANYDDRDRPRRGDPSSGARGGPRRHRADRRQGPRDPTRRSAGVRYPFSDAEVASARSCASEAVSVLRPRHCGARDRLRAARRAQRELRRRSPPTAGASRAANCSWRCAARASTATTSCARPSRRARRRPWCEDAERVERPDRVAHPGGRHAASALGRLGAHWRDALRRSRCRRHRQQRQDDGQGDDRHDPARPRGRGRRCWRPAAT